jgi:ferritin
MELLTYFLKEQMKEENLFEELLIQYGLKGKRNGLWDHHIKHP